LIDTDFKNKHKFSRKSLTYSQGPFGRAFAAASPSAEAEALPKGAKRNSFVDEAQKSS
jgi:hypothetical protein